MTAPVQTPSAPATEITQSGPFGIDDALASISQSAIQQTLAEQTPTAPTDSTPPGEQPRGPDGKFVPRADALATDDESDPTAVPAPDATAPDAAADPEAEPVALPEGLVAVPPVKDRELATAFKVLDHDGELDVPDITIEFQANGKTRKEPLDKVVRLAERGVYNEEREQAVLQQRAEAQAVQQQYQQVIAYARQLEAEREQLLASDDAYLMARAKYEEQHTPEARLAQLQQQREVEQQQQVYQQARTVSNQFFEGSVLPAVETIAQHLPTVTADEIGARLVLLTNHLRVPTPEGDTFIPPAAHEAVKQIIARDIVTWAQGLHEERDASTKAEREAQAKAKAEADAKAKKAQAEAQKAKNLVGRQTRPAGRANTGTATREAPPQKPIKTVEDAEAAVLRDTLAAVL